MCNMITICYQCQQEQLLALGVTHLQLDTQVLEVKSFASGGKMASMSCNRRHDDIFHGFRLHFSNDTGIAYKAMSYMCYVL